MVLRSERRNEGGVTPHPPEATRCSHRHLQECRRPPAPRGAAAPSSQSHWWGLGSSKPAEQGQGRAVLLPQKRGDSSHPSPSPSVGRHWRCAAAQPGAREPGTTGLGFEACSAFGEGLWDPPNSPLAMQPVPKAARRPSPGGRANFAPCLFHPALGRKASELFPPPYFQKAAPCPNTFPAGSPPGDPPVPKTSPGPPGPHQAAGPPPHRGHDPPSLPFPPAPRTYRLAGCASRSRSQCHARPLRAAPPAPGVSSSPGLPLPTGDMARGRWDTSGAGAGRKSGCGRAAGAARRDL